MSLDDVELNLVTSIDDVLRLKEWMGRRRSLNALAFDTETSGLHWNDRVRLIQVGDDVAGWAMDRDDWLGLFRNIVDTWEGDWIGHNSPFDTTKLEKNCNVHIPRNRIHDTMVRARINESHMSMALKSQAARHVDPAAAGLQAELAGTKWTWENVPVTYGPYWMYGALDPVLTYKLEEYHRPITERDAPQAYDIEMAVLWVVERMRWYGAHVDRALAQRRFDEFMSYCKQVEHWTQSEYGVKPGSNAAIIRILEDAGYTFSKATKSGAIALDKDVLEGIEHPLAQAVLSRRQAQKMASTYLQFYVENADENNLLHPSFNTLGARTSRMSCSDPNLQNLPRLGTSKFGDIVRNCFKTRWGVPWNQDISLAQNATDDGRGALVMCDFDQIEMRMLAHFAQEQGMISAFKSEGDFFVNLARQIYQDDTITKKDKRRQVTKNAGYAKIYSAGVQKFAQTAGITVSQARDFLNRFDTLYPGVKDFQNAVLSTAMQRQRETGLAYARSPLTGRRYVADSRKEYALINYLVQGAAAEVNKMKLIELDAAGLGEWMFATVHDEVLLDVPGGHVPDVINVLNKIMNDDNLLSVPITAGISVGERWGEKKDWVEPE